MLVGMGFNEPQAKAALQVGRVLVCVIPYFVSLCLHGMSLLSRHR